MNIYTDGHPLGLNGQGGLFANSGYTLVQLSRTERRHLRYKKPRLTNNEAEIVAIIHAAALASTDDTILSDSRIAINYVLRGGGKLERLAFLAEIAKSIVEEKQLKLQWIPREENPVT